MTFFSEVKLIFTSRSVPYLSNVTNQTSLKIARDIPLSDIVSKFFSFYLVSHQDKLTLARFRTWCIVHNSFAPLRCLKLAKSQIFQMTRKPDSWIFVSFSDQPGIQATDTRICAPVRVDARMYALVCFYVCVRVYV